MRFPCCCAALCLAAPILGWSSTVSFSNFTQNNSSNAGGGTPFYQNADLNNDGIEDLVYAYHPEMGGQDTFAVQLATGTGVYSQAKWYELPSDAEGIGALLIGDVNNDGSPDLVASGVSSSKFYVYLNDGKGNFTLANSFLFGTDPDSSNASAAIADFNHDSFLDLVVIQDGQLQVWFGDGTGAFRAGPLMKTPGVGPQVGDFDGDGKADLLLNSTSYTTAYVLFGDGTGNFPQTATIASQPGLTLDGFTVGDVNSDAKSDIMAISPNSPSRVFVFYGDTSRQFGSSTSMLIGRCVAGSAVVADLDGNGFNDLIVPERDCDNDTTGPLYIDVLTRNPDSSYNPDQTVYWAQPVDGGIYEIPNPPLVLHANHDTKPDLLITQCADNRCDGSILTTQINTTQGNFHSCDAPAASSGINICSPVAGSTAGSPVKFSVGAAGSLPMRDVEVWVDGTKMAEQVDGFSHYTFLDATVPLASGDHKIDVYAAAWDQSLIERTIYLTVQ